MFSKLKDFLLKYQLLITSIIFVILRIPSFFRGFAAVDEGMYMGIARAILSGKQLYIDAWDHKPPGMTLIFLPFANLDQTLALTILRLLSIVIGVVTLLIFYKILVKLKVNSSDSIFILLFSAILLGTPIFDSWGINSEIFFLVLNALLLYRVLCNKLDYLTGFILFAQFMIKPQGFFEGGLILFIYFLNELLQKKSLIKKVFKVLLGFLVPLICVIIFFVLQNNFNNLWEAIFKYNFIYVNQSDIQTMFLGHQFSNRILMQLFFGISFLVCGIIFIFQKKLKINFEFLNYLFVNIILFEVFCILYPERNYTHYGIQYILGNLLFIVLILRLIKKERSHLKNILIVLSYFVGTIVIFIFFGMGNLRNIYVNNIQVPVSYYYRFTKDILIKKDYESFKDFSRATDSVGEYIKNNYGNYNNSFLYTATPWLYSISGISFSNRYFYYMQMYYTWDMFNSESEIMLSSKLIIIQNDVAIKDILQDKLNAKYHLVDSYKNYDYYLSDL